MQHEQYHHDAEHDQRGDPEARVLNFDLFERHVRRCLGELLFKQELQQNQHEYPDDENRRAHGDRKRVEVDIGCRTDHDVRRVADQRADAARHEHGARHVLEQQPLPLRKRVHHYDAGGVRVDPLGSGQQRQHQ